MGEFFKIYIRVFIISHVLQIESKGFLVSYEQEEPIFIYAYPGSPKKWQARQQHLFTMVN